jgi:hypothetical protein
MKPKVRKPRSIQIMGKKVPIRYLKDLTIDEDNGDSSELDGYFCSNPLSITIRNDDRWLEHLWHEILHCVLHLSGVSNSLTEKLEENIVVAIETGLFKHFKL